MARPCRDLFGPQSVHDLPSAKLWLWRFGRAHEWIYNAPDDLPLHVALVCDMFWVSPAKLLADMRRDWKAALREPAARRPHRRNAGWR